MSASQAVPTSMQPSHAISNVTAHPGSTWAGVGVAAVTIGQTISAGTMPTTASGWVSFVAGLAFAILAALGK